MSDDDEEFGRSLKGLDTPAKYPEDLKSATRSEFITLARVSKKDNDGCPLFIFMLVIKVITLISLTIYLG